MDEEARNCTECGSPVAYGSRNYRCGAMAMHQEPQPTQSEIDATQTCVTCAHKRCMFSGEDRPPIYRGQYPRGVHCWIDPNSEFGVQLMTHNASLTGAEPKAERPVD